MIHGIKHLIDMRKSGRLPVYLRVNVDCDYLGTKYDNELAYLVLMAEGDLRLDDFRPFVGLDVILYAPKATKTFADLIDRMKQYANFMTVFCGEYGDDLGWEWSKKWGTCEFGETQWAEQWDNARKSGCYDKQQLEERLRLEQEAIAHCPWINERIISGAVNLRLD